MLLYEIYIEGIFRAAIEVYLNDLCPFLIHWLGKPGTYPLPGDGFPISLQR
jgi:hypothetical protein